MSRSGSGSTCTTQHLSALSNTQTFHTWYQAHATAINTYLTTLRTAPTNPDGRADVSVASMTVTPEQRTDILRRTTDIMNMSLCLQESINSNAGTSNGISAAQEQILDLNDQIREEEANTSIAKDRVSYIRHPEQGVSNYESWFPIDRPMHTFSLLVIMSISLFVALFSLLMLCSLLGVDLMLYTDPSQTYTSGMMNSLYDQFTPVTLIILAVLVGVLAYFLNRS